MHSTDRRELLAGGTAFVACCLCRGVAAASELPKSFDMIAYCCLDCAQCDAYRATVKKDDALRAEVAARWKMKPEQIECLGRPPPPPPPPPPIKKCASK